MGLRDGGQWKGGKATAKLREKEREDFWHRRSEGFVTANRKVPGWRWRGGWPTWKQSMLGMATSFQELGLGGGTGRTGFAVLA